MGNGIAQVASTSGYRVTCMDVVPAALERAKATIAKSTAKLLEKEKSRSIKKQPRRGSISFPIFPQLLKQTWSSKPPAKTRIEIQDFPGDGRDGARRGYPGQQYIFHQHHQNCRCDLNRPIKSSGCTS
jgi:hypothetical protein